MSHRAYLIKGAIKLWLFSSILLSSVLLADDSLEVRLASPDRAEEDRNRDAGRLPAKVVEFLGVDAGMMVMDLIAANGYYTEVLSLAVGMEGKVYAQNPPFMLEFRDGAVDKALNARLENNRLANVERINTEIEEIDLGENLIDVAITALNFHDLYNRDPESAHQFLVGVLALLKPGGVLGVIDHAGVSGNDNSQLHRMLESDAVAAAVKAGFVVDATSDVLHNTVDDHSTGVFDPSVKGNTDRFLLRLKKPG